MAHPLMPKATAVWLVENTALTFEQISAFCGLHDLEVQAIADGEVATGMQGLDPIAGGELTQEELDRCDGDPKARLEMAKPDIPLPKARSKGARYTPVSKRQDRPDAIAWLVAACRASRVPEGAPPVRLPGEAARRRRSDQRAHGVTLDPATVDKLAPWAERYAVPAPADWS